MVEFLNDDTVFEGTVTTKDELIVNGTLTVGPGGVSVGASISDALNSWPGQTRVQVADVTERDAVVAWRTANAPISANNPLLVWRANGSLTGTNEITVDGVNWFSESPVAGDVEMTISTVAPYGWALMQGQLLANAAVDYPALWATASPALREGGSLRIPDMRGRVPMGAGQGTGLSLRNLGDKIGTETVALTTAQLASHKHSGTTADPDRSLNHTHYLRFEHESGNEVSGTDNKYELHNTSSPTIHETSGVYNPTSPTATSTLKHKHTFDTATTGNGDPHPNIPPALVLNFKVKL